MIDVSVEKLEQSLDDFDYAERKNALEALVEKVESDEITLPQVTTDVNLHLHSFFSYNSNGYSPGKIAWLARKHGLAAAAVVDFDVLDAMDEFLSVAKILGLKACAGLETRVFVPEFSDKVINSPGEPGIAYHIGIGFPNANLEGRQNDFLLNLRQTAQKRNLELMQRVNEYLKPVELDYEKDVLALTPSGNATERHICIAFARRASQIFHQAQALAHFWTEKLGINVELSMLPESINLLDAIRSKTMKRGGAGYVTPDKKSFPLLADTNRFFLEAGAIPAVAWLDGTSEGEQDMERLLEVAMNSGAAAINIIPGRNYTPGVKDEKLKNLYNIVDLAEKLDLPVLVGTEMNVPGQKFVDSFDSQELSPLVPVFLKGANIVYAHSVLQRQCGLGYISRWANENFENAKQKNEFFEKQLLKTQHAVQLSGPGKLILNKSKDIFPPAAHQILCKVEAVGLCFSDLKFLKQFSFHPRKGRILSGINPEILEQIPSYVPGDSPAVPGHETVIRIEAAGPGVEKFKTGQRYLVQTDYRWLTTDNSNAALGYNFEGALQEYVLMDERIITSPEGDPMLIPVSENLSCSAVALVEPWACVEDAYAGSERRNLKTNGKTLIVADMQLAEGILQELFSRYGKPARITWISGYLPPDNLGESFEKTADVSQVDDNSYDDIIYFGSDVETAEDLFIKLAAHGLYNIVLCGGSFSREVNVPVGKVHYSYIRIIGTQGKNPAQSYDYIPVTGEARPGDKINIVGAAGPMGLMHVVRNICHDIAGLSIFAGDIDDARLARLTKIAEPLAKKNHVEYKPYNSKKEKTNSCFDYTILMTPMPELVSESILAASENGIINIFAGIPATVFAGIDLNAYIKKKLYFIGTSGSTIEDMKTVLIRVEAGKVDTNTSVAAISGLDGAVEGIRAVENHSIPGKIIVYPACKGLGLITLEELNVKMPEVAAMLNNGLWTKQAEQKLLEKYGKI